MKVHVTGDSHVGAIKRAFDLLNRAGQIPGDIDLAIAPLGSGHTLATPFFRDMGDHLEILESQLRRRVERFPLPAVAAYGFCAPLHTSRVLRQHMWQKFAPFQICADGETPLSGQIVKSMILGDQQHMLRFIEGLQRLGKKVFVIEAPRPFRHHPALRKTRPVVFIYLDTEYRRIMQAELSARGVPVVGLPNDVFDEDGFMHSRLRKEEDEDDLHHGNTTFGALMLDEIFKFLRSAGWVPQAKNS